MRAAGFVTVLALLGAPLLAQTPGDVAAFQMALARDDIDEAARIADRQIELRRPKDSALRPDPLINAMVGQLWSARGDPQVARSYLAHASLAELPDAVRADPLFAQADAEERMGDRRQAEATLAGIDELKPNAEQSRRLAYARARIALVDDPARATGIVTPAIAAAPRPEDRWEGEFILGAARALLGDVAGSRAASDRAWIAAASARCAVRAWTRGAAARGGCGRSGWPHCHADRCWRARAQG